jgi:hypothetical protein
MTLFGSLFYDAFSVTRLYNVRAVQTQLQNGAISTIVGKQLFFFQKWKDAFMHIH